MEEREAVELVADRVAKIRKIMGGLSPQIQGAILADLLAIWLAGHRSLDGDDKKLRQHVLANFMRTMRQLIPVNVAIQDDWLKSKSH
jgi:two-component sensor histidine kinase